NAPCGGGGAGNCDGANCGRGGGGAHSPVAVMKQPLFGSNSCAWAGSAVASAASSASRAEPERLAKQTSGLMLSCSSSRSFSRSLRIFSRNLAGTDHHTPKNLPRIAIARTVPRIFTKPPCACAPPCGGRAPQCGQTLAVTATSFPHDMHCIHFLL